MAINSKVSEDLACPEGEFAEALEGEETIAAAEVGELEGVNNTFEGRRFTSVFTVFFTAGITPLTKLELRERISAFPVLTGAMAFLGSTEMSSFAMLVLGDLEGISEDTKLIPGDLVDENGIEENVDCNVVCCCN
jgi:hypothetical protein